MLERFFRSACQEVGVGSDFVARGSPDKVLQPLLQALSRIAVIGPCGHIAVVRGGSPESCLVVNPYDVVGSVSGSQDGLVGIGSDAEDPGLTVSGHLQFIADGADIEPFRRVLVCCHPSPYGAVFHAVHGTQGLAVHPVHPHDTMVCRSGSCRNSGCCRGAVGIGKRIFCCAEHTPFFKETLESVLPVEWGKGFEVVAPELVNHDVDHYARYAVPRDVDGLCLSFGLGGQRRQQGDECE